MSTLQKSDDNGSRPEVLYPGASVDDDSASIGELAASDIRKVEVLRKHGFDYCCRGKMSLLQACNEKGLAIGPVEKELEEALQTKRISRSPEFDRWNLDFLADYIYNEHHLYFYHEGPQISSLMEKVVAHHLVHHPFLATLSALYSQLRAELHTHFLKEENLIFPHIKAMVKARNNNARVDDSAVVDMRGPILVMETEHEAAGEILHLMNGITNNYTPPADACSSFLLLYNKLQSLDEDLHQHIHLENNLLFPKATKLENEMYKRH